MFLIATFIVTICCKCLYLHILYSHSCLCMNNSGSSTHCIVVMLYTTHKMDGREQFFRTSLCLSNKVLCFFYWHQQFTISSLLVFQQG